MLWQALLGKLWCSHQQQQDQGPVKVETTAVESFAVSTKMAMSFCRQVELPNTLVEFAITAPNQARCQLAVVLLKALPLNHPCALQLLSVELTGMGMFTTDILAVCISALVTWCEHAMLRQLAT